MIMILITKKFNFLPDEKTTGLKIKSLRLNSKTEKGKKMTVNELAKKIDEEFGVEIMDKTINKWEQGKAFPMYENMFYLSCVFNTNIESLLLPDHYNLEDLNKISYSFNFNNGYLESQYPGLFELDLSNAIESRLAMNYLFQKTIFSYLNENESELFELKLPSFYCITEYGKELYKDQGLTTLETIKKYVNEKYGYSIKQEIPSDEEFNSIMYSVLKVVNDFELEEESDVFGYLINKTKSEIDLVISALNLFQRDFMMTALLCLEMNYCDRLQYVYDSLKKHGAKRLCDKEKEKFYYQSSDVSKDKLIQEYKYLQFGHLKKGLHYIVKYFKDVEYNEYINLRKDLICENYNEELKRLRGDSLC